VRLSFFLSGVLKTPTQADAERESYIVIPQSKVVEQSKSVVVAGFGRLTEGISSSKPRIDQKTPKGSLVACRG
jgi:hypothetical protein